MRKWDCGTPDDADAVAAILQQLLHEPPPERQRHLDRLTYWETQGLAASILAAWQAPTVIERLTPTIIETDAGNGYLAIAQARSRARRIVPA